MASETITTCEGNPNEVAIVTSELEETEITATSDACADQNECPPTDSTVKYRHIIAKVGTTPTAHNYLVYLDTTTLGLGYKPSIPRPNHSMYPFPAAMFRIVPVTTPAAVGENLKAIHNHVIPSQTAHLTTSNGGITFETENTASFVRIENNDDLPPAASIYFLSGRNKYYWVPSTYSTVATERVINVQSTIPDPQYNFYISIVL